MTPLIETSPKLDNTGEHPRRVDYHEKLVQFLQVALEPGTVVEVRAIKVDGKGSTPPAAIKRRK